MKIYPVERPCWGRVYGESWGRRIQIHPPHSSAANRRGLLPSYCLMGGLAFPFVYRGKNLEIPYQKIKDLRSVAAVEVAFLRLWIGRNSSGNKPVSDSSSGNGFDVVVVMIGECSGA